MKDDFPSVSEVLRTLMTAGESVRGSIRKSPDLETVRIQATALSERCLDAIQVLDHDDPYAHRLIQGLNATSFAAHELAEGIQNGNKTENERHARHIGVALRQTTIGFPGGGGIRLRVLRGCFADLSNTIVQVPGICVLGDQSKRDLASRTAFLAGALLATAARLLPAVDRPRYAMEFRAELSDIAAGGSRRAQITYAIRLVLAAPHLRTELKAPRRRSAPQ
jgi:hypothetical protein